jgi:hypothetical protein
MSPFWARLIRRSVISASVLAVVGYLLGRAFLYAYRIQSGGSYNPENERVLWQSPLTMAALGFILTAITECIAEPFRKPAKQAAKAPPSSGPIA